MQAEVAQSQEQKLQHHIKQVLDEISVTGDPTELGSLHQKFNEFVDQLDYIRRSTINRFNLLPTELLNQIFAQYCLGQDSQGPFALLLVCRHWLNIVTHCPDLWTQVSIRSHDLHWSECMDIYAQRSRDRLLDVTLEFPFSNDELDRVIAQGDIARWKSLTIQSSREIGTDMLRLPRRVREAPSVIYLFQNGKFTNLQSIDVQLKTAAAGSTMLWSNLFPDSRALDNVPVKQLLLSHLTVNLFFIDFPAFIIALKELPGLIYLKFLPQRHPDAPTPPPESDEDSISLPKLHELLMIQQPRGMMLLRRLDAPSLKKLSFSLLMGEIPAFYKIVQSIRSLKSLHLVLHGVPNIAPLEESPSLELDELMLSYPPPTNSQYILGSDSDEGASFLSLLRLFSQAKKVIITDLSTKWYNIISVFQETEDLYMFRTKSAYQKHLEVMESPDQVILLPRLSFLHVEGDLCDMVISVLRAPNLRALKVVDAPNIAPEELSMFIRSSPGLQRMHLEAVSSSPSSMETQHSRSESIQLAELSVTHDARTLIQDFEFANLKVLKLTGALQGVAMQRGMFHFDRREIHLDAFLFSAKSGRPSVFANLVDLDLCVSTDLFPLVSGLEDVVPHLYQIEKVSLPRALYSTKILVDVLLQSILFSYKGDQSSNQNGVYCPHLEMIYTEDYPQWDCLTQLLLKRNTVSHASGERGERALKCLHLPALPHPSILRPLQTALGGKFPPRTQTEAEGVFSPKGCDDCALSGWHCLEQDINKDTKVRSQCGRHRRGAVRITAYS